MDINILAVYHCDALEALTLSSSSGGGLPTQTNVNWHHAHCTTAGRDYGQVGCHTTGMLFNLNQSYICIPFTPHCISNYSVISLRLGLSIHN